MKHIKVLMKSLRAKNDTMAFCIMCKPCPLGESPHECHLCLGRRAGNGGDENRRNLYNELARLVGVDRIPKTHTITIDDKKITMSDESYQNLKKELADD